MQQHHPPPDETFPGKWIGVCALPQTAGEPIQNAIPELERCVKLGFVGCLFNPDPYENSGTEAPALGDRYWYPLYEKLCELDMPAHIHGTGSRSERRPYSRALHQRRIHRGFRPGELQRLQRFPQA